MTANNQIRIAMPVAILVALAIQFIAPSAFAATVYWDSNGTVAGAGATPTGTWGTSTFWNATSTGLTTTPAAWLSGDTAVFSAGTDAVNAFTVTLSGTQTIGGLTVEEGTPTISGGTALAINSATTPFNIDSSATTPIFEREFKQPRQIAGPFFRPIG